ncbi:Tyrosine kinase [Handroanthus impetiginosus]|uniref:Tyrosine kinase n=1 Tax=Handroanthus impetiginosus TaxID=429701 RepID=A0A2G9H3Z3_9LAMI|nr:Tyrosine kinase [Handroanthus impetiginosus]
MKPSKNHNYMQGNSLEQGNEDLDPEPLGHGADTPGHANGSLKSPETNFAEPKPVLNYSIQTGEEFALEFMRDRVNPRHPLPPNITGDPSYATGYLELKGILGISHTGSESGSDVSVIATTGKSSREFERTNLSIHGNWGNHGSSQSMRHASSDCSHHTLMYASSGASDSSALKLKILCSFGGRILPRPSDAKLRYVGGETRIIRISKDITWQELWEKTTAIYDETHTIKYQLPGEDLDALVSVSSDEDLLNMMEECNVLEVGEGSKKLRMFLFSLGDLEDAHFSLTNTDGDSEIKYVVAVNGMDAASRKGSTLRGLASSSGNNLNELDTLNVERDTCRTTTEFVGINTSNMGGFAVPSTATDPSTSIFPNSFKFYEPDLHFYNGHPVHRHEDKQHPPQFGYNFHPPYETPSESAIPQSSYETVSQQKGFAGKSLSSLGTQGTEMQEKELKLKIDGSIPPESGTNQMLANEHFVAYNGNTKVSFPDEEAPIAVPKLDREFSSKTSKSEVMPQEPLQVSKPLDAVNPSQLPISSGNDFCTSGIPGPESINSESDPTDFGYFESSFPPQRVFYSERIPREQAGRHSRISKSDDSHSSQLLANQSSTDITQQDLVPGSVERLQNGNVIPTEQSIAISPVESETFDNGHPRTQTVDKLDVKDSVHVNQVPVAEAEAGLKLPAVGHEDSVKHYEDPITHWVDGVGSQSNANNAHGHPQPSAWTGAEEESRAADPRTEQGDILIDINDRFPRDLLSDIFSKAILSDSSSDIGRLQKDGAGLSVNIENHEPKHWSFFQRLAGDEFTRRDVSLIDQDHVVFSSGLAKGEEASLAYDFAPPNHREAQDNYAEDNQKGIPGGDGAVGVALHSNNNASQVKVSESIQYDDLMDNMRIQDSDYEDGMGKIGLPPVDPSLVDFDINSLQIIHNLDLEELKELGSGTFGTVYHGKWRGSDVAIKRIKKSCFTGRQSEQERLTVEFWREAEILSQLHHPNVVAFYGVVQDGPGGTLATVTEYMVDGSLRHVLVRKDRHLDRRKRLIIAMDAAFGMEYLHSKNIVHFDLKCDNLLVNLKDPSRPICKVGDFGLSKIKRNTLVSGGVRGTLPWMAPELLNGSSNKVSEKVDVFSFGIVLWEILTGEEPYANMHYGAIIGGIVNNTLRPTIPSYCDQEWRRLMEQCWAPNPAVRPSFTEIASRLRVMSASAQPRKAS